MTRAVALVGLALSSAALGATKFVGGGLELGPAAPVLLPVASPSQPVHVSQILYTQAELGFAANTRIIDVAWRKEGLGPATGSGGCAEQVWMKNVARQAGPFTVGSTQALVDALQSAQKVIDRPASGLPSTMGFVTLDAVENQFNFTYLGDALEVTVITDCRAAASPVVDAPVLWRYDAVPERVRTTSGASTDALTLIAEPVLSSFRPHTRFRTLVDTPGVELRIAGNLLPNGGAFAVAPKHFAAGLPANFAFELWNPSTLPLTLDSVATSGVQNGTVMSGVTTPVTVQGGQSLAIPLVFGPTLAGTVSRFTVTWSTSAGAQSNTFQGTPTATPEPQPAAAFEKPDGTTQALVVGTPLVLQRGLVPPGHSFLLTCIGSNFGQGSVEAHAEKVSGEVEVLTGSTMVGSQQDLRIISRVRAPMAVGPFSTELRVLVGGLTYLVRESGTVAAPDLKVSVGGVEINRGQEERITRSSRGPFVRTYEVANVGSLPLVFSERLSLSNRDKLSALTPASPKVLLPAGSAMVPFEFGELNPGAEPFTFETVSNDPSTPTFSWTATTALPGRRQLAVSALVDGDVEYPYAVMSGATLENLKGRSVVLTIANVGDSPVVVSALGERCRGCIEARRTTPNLPVTLQPGEALLREVAFEVADWRLEYAIASDAEGSPLTFVLEGRRKGGCSTAFPGPLLAPLAGLWLARRRVARRR